MTSLAVRAGPKWTIHHAHKPLLKFIDLTSACCPCRKSWSAQATPTARCRATCRAESATAAIMSPSRTGCWGDMVKVVSFQCGSACLHDHFLYPFLTMHHHLCAAQSLTRESRATHQQTLWEARGGEQLGFSASRTSCSSNNSCSPHHQPRWSCRH